MGNISSSSRYVKLEMRLETEEGYLQKERTLKKTEVEMIDGEKVLTTTEHRKRLARGHERML